MINQKGPEVEVIALDDGQYDGQYRNKGDKIKFDGPYSVDPKKPNIFVLPLWMVTLPDHKEVVKVEAPKKEQPKNTKEKQKNKEADKIFG